MDAAEHHELKFPGKTLTLNSEQYRAVTRPANVNQRIVASAGSGKTTTLTARIAWLIQTEGVQPESIVLLTFSRNAANQMKQRLEDLLGTDSTDIWIGTFHGLARSLLQKYEPQDLQKLYFVDELIYMGVQWLQGEKGEAWISNIRYIFIDEFQDINESQWKMIAAMRKGAAKLVVVGDDAQNIYTWRGSDVSFILDFHKKLKVVDDQLRCNYRSSSSIVAAANGTLKHIPSLPWKETMIAKKGAGPKPEVHFFWRACDETEWVVRQVEHLRKQRPKWTFAVLSRTNSDLYRIEETLQAKGHPYRLRDVIDELHDEKRGTLDLVTLHASKGLEWDCVFLVGCNDDCFPAKKSAAEIICERRLFYVGVTRARSVLYFTYTNKETALSRFVREIPRVHIIYTGLAKYVLSDYDRAEGKSRLIDILGGLDGNKLQLLRAQGIFQTIERENWMTGQLFPPGLWTIPTWAMGYDRGGDFLRFLRLWLYRHLWKYMGDAEPFREPALERVLFTLRVYAEEREFFEEWQTEVIEMLHTWFGNAQDTVPTVDFHEVKAWVLQKGLGWSVDEIVKATTLLAKLRGQLRPLRFDKYELSEFRIGSARYVVPTESRAESLRSWRAVSDRSKGWKEVLGDLWRLGALGLCAEGRNAALYRVIEMSEHLKNSGVVDFLETLEGALAPWMIRQGKDIQFGLELANQDIFTDTLDIVATANRTLWKICVEQKMDALSILELAVRGSLARREGLTIDTVGWILPLEGTYVTIKIDNTWDSCVDKLLA